MRAPIKRLSLEELMEIDVTLPTRGTEAHQNVPAAISVLTAEDVRRSGAVVLPEVLWFAPGVFAGRFNSTTWNITTRGFASNGANKLLVMIDGRTVYSPLFSGVFWEQQDTFLPDIDRIEIIRGPGAALWGANAVNGVLNVVSRSASETTGTVAVAGGGIEERAFAAVRHGAPIGGRGHYRIYGKVTDRDGGHVSTGEDAGDWQRSGQTGFRVDLASRRDALTLQGDAVYSHAGLLDRGHATLGGGNVMVRWTRRFGPASDLRVQFYYDRTHRSVPQQIRENRGTYDVDLQHRVQPFSRHDLTWGAGFRVSRDDTSRSALLFFDPGDTTTSLGSAFVQDGIALGRGVHLTLGSKLEANDYTGLEVQPTARVRWSPVARHTLWGAVSRAVRMPTRFDTDLRVTDADRVVITGQRDFRSEDLVAVEAGYRAVPAPSVSADVSAFHHRYDDLRSQEAPVVPGPIVIGNSLVGRSSGVELVTAYEPLSWVRLLGSYSYLHLRLRTAPGSRDLSGGIAEANDPAHQVLLQGRMDLPKGVELDGTVRWTSALPHPRAPSYAEAAARLAVRLSPAIRLSLVGQNLLHDRHVRFATATSGRQFAIDRAVYARLTFGF